MELDSLKHIWQAGSEREVAQNSYDPAAIRGLLSGKSQGVIAEIKRNLSKEIIITIIAMVCFLFLPFIYSGAILQILLGSWAFLSGLFLVFYYQKYQTIESYAISHDNVKENLKALIDRLQKYTRFYFWGNVTLIPLVHITNYIFMRLLDLDPFHHLETSTGRVMFAGYIILTTGLIIAFFRWYIHKLYGNYIEQLHGFVKELEDM